MPKRRGSQSATETKGRVMAIDALRGFDMFWIVGGKGLFVSLLLCFMADLPSWLDRQLEHDWGGFVAWDLIMPLFLFICGTSMPFSFAKRLARGDGKLKLYMKILSRAVILFVLGMIVQGHLLEFDSSKLHLYSNTLQAIAAGYVITGIVFLNFRALGQIIAPALLLLAYWALMAFVPFPGHAAGTLKPDANLALYVDTLVLGRFSDGTPYTWVLSSLTFGATVLLGMLGGQILRAGRGPAAKVLGLLGAAAACLLMGWLWSHFYPINKHVWSSPMTLWAAGWSYLLLGLFYLVIDVWNLRLWAFPFVVLGANAIFAYVSPTFLDYRNIGQNVAGGLAEHLGRAGDFTLALTSFLLAWGLLYYFYRKSIFFRI